MITDDILQDDTYHVWVPIDDELVKSIEVDENGDYVVSGVITSDNLDEEDDSITPEGMDCTYFLDKGWVKYEHGNAPSQFIGEPLEVKIGQFTHPSRHELVKGIFLKAKLFAQRKLAQEAIQTMQDLQKSSTKRMMGWSIEGSVKERNRKTGKIVKSILRNVVLTMNPVNTMTWAELAKSFSKDHALIIDMPIEKSMDIATAAAIMPQSLEGGVVDPQEKWLKLFKDFCSHNFLHKSITTKFVTGSPSTAGMMSYTFALGHGLDNEEAFEFASYIADRYDILKSIFNKKVGGGDVGKAALESLLDDDLADLRKSLVDDTDDEDLLKSHGKEDDEEDKDDDDKKKEDDDDGDKDDDEAEKSLEPDFVKSLTSNPENAQALEVSDFLQNMTEEIGYSMDGLTKSMTLVSKQQAAVTNALISTLDMIKGLAGKLDDLQAENAELKKSLDAVMEMPVGRKSVVSKRELPTMARNQGDGKGDLTRPQALGILMKSFENKLISGMTVSRFEAGVPLQKLGLPDEVKAELGMV